MSLWNALFLYRSLGYFLNNDRVAMTSKGAKETIVTRLGFKSSSSAPKAEAELERVRKENAHLRRKIDELAKRHIKPPDSDKSKLLEVKEVFVLSVILKNFRVIYRFPCMSVCLSLGCFLICICYLMLIVSEDPFPWDAAREKQSAAVC